MFMKSHDIGVFDGVGGWRDQGIDPGIYSRQLADGVSEFIALSRAQSNDGVDLAKALDFGGESCKLNQLTGSSTACIATLDAESKVLRTCNLGDSGIVLFRKVGNEVKVSHRAEITTIGFNFPRQIGNIADPKLGRMESDTSKNAKYNEFHLLSGDVTLAASDGIWDNLFDEDICEILGNSSLFEKDSKAVTKEDLDVVVQEVISLALKKSTDSKGTTPWSVSVVEHYKERGYRGGKPDDMTVIVSHFTDVDKH
jgi:protein phosphatase PTC7